MTHTSIRLLVAAALLAIAASASAQAPALHAQVPPLVNGMYASLDALYKDLHANPEMAYQEVRTAARLAEEMRKLGFEVTEKIGKTGIVAIYKNGAGPTVMVRTELDALPMEEKTGLPYASKAKTQYAGRETFVAHSCGHDIHMASWVGTARTLLALKDQWKGTLMFVAQPAEETVTGAKSMLDDGLFKRFGKPDQAFALHTSPSPYGFVGVRAGPTSSNSDGLEITFKGRGGHGSAPDKTIDPITIAARFITDVQTVVSREKDPAEFGVVTVGAIQGGTVGNIIPDQVVLRGTIRSYKPEVREKLLAGIRRTAQAAAMMGGAPEPDVALVPGGAAIVNDAAVVNRTTAAIQAVMGGAQVVQVPPITASEDFSEFLNAGVPGMMFFVGVSAPEDVAAAMKPGGKPLAFNHSPFFAPAPEPSIKTGVQAMSVAVLTALALK
ncbi:amidohydrolase [Pseudorhodoferax sp. Leaf267]|uniref:amidohydrolase n=1 Tax=Pseudorhodoferax sp. Leaf267 TaxID=1736316 RepID=UPI0006FE2FF3|nr:amidohydrolase [Pseudorhodoferax sp. Leaf267]KQP20541.1 peptidase M20 [Pseudorhodoferax sp. Leaf267]